MTERITKRRIRETAQDLAEQARSYEKGLLKLPPFAPEAVYSPYRERILILRALEAGLRGAVGDIDHYSFVLLSGATFGVEFNKEKKK